MVLDTRPRDIFLPRIKRQDDRFGARGTCLTRYFFITFVYV